MVAANKRRGKVGQICDKPHLDIKQRFSSVIFFPLNSVTSVGWNKVEDTSRQSHCIKVQKQGESWLNFSPSHDRDLTKSLSDLHHLGTKDTEKSKWHTQMYCACLGADTSLNYGALAQSSISAWDGMNTKAKSKKTSRCMETCRVHSNDHANDPTLVLYPSFQEKKWTNVNRSCWGILMRREFGNCNIWSALSERR